MSPEQIALVRSTHQLVAPGLDQLVVAVRHTISATHPELGPALPFDPRPAESDPTATLSELISRVTDLPSFRERAASAGRVHKQSGASARHYQVFFPSLTDALADALGDEWNDDVAAAWRLVFALMTQSMLDGAVI
ncbi:MAG: putative hemoprotein [Acidimicrobiales bacterium]|nr:putative hemoprotein [Acidimicrobiales bacterium]